MTYLFLLVSNSSFCQKQDSVIVATIECWTFSDGLAKKDIEEGEIKILFKSKDSSLRLSANDSLFQINYKVKFQLLKNNYPISCLRNYNKVVYEYLDKTYGNKWRESIRKDAIGFK